MLFITTANKVIYLDSQKLRSAMKFKLIILMRFLTNQNEAKFEDCWLQFISVTFIYRFFNSPKGTIRQVVVFPMHFVSYWSFTLRNSVDWMLWNYFLNSKGGRCRKVERIA